MAAKATVSVALFANIDIDLIDLFSSVDYDSNFFNFFKVIYIEILFSAVEVVRRGLRILSVRIWIILVAFVFQVHPRKHLLAESWPDALLRPSVADESDNVVVCNPIFIDAINCVLSHDFKNTINSIDCLNVNESRCMRSR